MVKTPDTPGLIKEPDRAGPAFTRAIAAWWIYDWANSAFGTLITTFIFAPYFIADVAPDATRGQVLWGWASGAAAVMIALLGPVLGAIADQGGARKAWLLATTGLCVAASAALYLVAPGAAHVALALAIFMVAVIASELSLVFYNSMLPGLAGPKRTGFVSGWGLGIGYLGGVASLGAALLLLVGPGALLAGLDSGASENVRAVGPLVAVWYGLFALPLFFLTPDTGAPARPPAQVAIRHGLETLARTFREARRHANLFRYLIAFLFYANGVSTLFAFGGIFAVGVFGFTLAEVTLFAIALNLAAGAGAAAFSWLDDRIGARPCILLALGGLTAAGTVLVLTSSLSVFWSLGILLGGCVGAVQATSRSLMARLAPPAMEAEMFGLYALAGKATAFAGPLVLATVTDLADSQRAGMATVLAFFIAGWVLMLRVQEPGR